MEEWQSAHIENNLVRLINTTTCGVALITHLRLANLMSPEEGVKLKHTQTSNADKAKFLYEILLTRQNSYQALVQAFRDTFQAAPLEILENHTLNYKEFSNFKFNENHLLGKNIFGAKVYGGEFNGTNAAVKYLSTYQYKPDNVLNEIQVLLNTPRHGNVAQYFDVCSDLHGTYIVMERCYISLLDEVKLQLANLDDIDILKQCTEGLDHLHRCEIIHGNLKPSNVLLTLDKQVKISDFGLSNLLSQEFSSNGSVRAGGRTEWMAAEVLRDLTIDPFSTSPPNLFYQSDVFTLGCIYYFTLTKGRHLFDLGDGSDIPNNIENDQSVLHVANMKHEFCPLIKMMIHKDIAGRPSTSQILQDKVFTGNKGNLNTGRNSNTPTPSVTTNLQRSTDPRRSLSISPIPYLAPYDMVSTVRKKPDTPTPSWAAYYGDMNTSQTTYSSTSSMTLNLDLNDTQRSNTPPPIVTTSKEEVSASETSHTSTSSASPPPVEPEPSHSKKRPSPFSLGCWNLKKKKSGDQISKRHGWKTWHLYNNRTYLAHNMTLQPKFFKRLRGKGVLSEFYLKKCIALLSEQNIAEIFTLPFVRSSFFDYLKAELYKTGQQVAYEVLENGQRTMEQWAAKEAIDRIVDFDSLAEAIRFNCEVSLLRQISHTKDRKRLLFETSEDESTLLHVAVQSGHVEAVKFLLKKGLDVNSKNSLENVPLHLVGWCGSDAVEITKLLVENGADVTVKNARGKTIALKASLNLLPEEYYAWVEYMTSKPEADTDLCLHEGLYESSLLHEVVPIREISKATIRLFSLTDFDFSMTNNNDYTVYQLAVQGHQEKGVLKCITKLEKEKAKKVNKKSRCNIL